MEFAVRTRSKKSKALIEHVLPSIIKQLKLTKSKKFLLIEVGRAAGPGNAGCTVPLPGIDSVVVSLTPAKLHDLGITLAHEMVHVKQLAKGTLRSENGVNYWRGKRYSSRVRYMNRPWELEAFARQEILFRRAIEG